MAFFAFREKGLVAPSSQPADQGLSEHIRSVIPRCFEAVAEALAAGQRATDACEVVGRLLATSGVSLEEVLADLRTTYELVVGAEPAYADACALALGWSEATLSYLHQLSCADPLTGLASTAHLRGRLTELYRGGTREPALLRERYALVVIEASSIQRSGLTEEVFGTDLRMSRVGDSVRSVFSGAETICRVGPRRIVVLTGRDNALGRRTALLRRLLDAGQRTHGGIRIWTESLPDTNVSVAALLDELSRDQAL
jgi:GGDEF domain-containing protein